jgi:hypothetical protein
MTEPGPAELAELAEAALYRPAAGLTLLGEQEGDGSGRAEPRFLVRRADGQVIRLSRLLYQVTSAIAAGGAEGGWNADQVASLAGAQLGRGLSAENIRFLAFGKLVPLGVVVAGRAGEFPDETPDAAPAPPSGPKTRRRGRAAAIGAAVVLTVAAVAAVTVAVAAHRTPAPARRDALASAGTGASGGNGASAGTGAGPGSTAQAAAWVAREISPGTTVACDPAMCRQLQQAGYPASRLKPLPASAPDLLGSGVVVATTAVRDQLGARLAAYYAPQLIASFGSGTARVDVRTVATGGAGQFKAQLAAEHAAQASAGQQMLGNTSITASKAARAALEAGQVDWRLLAILSALSHQVPVTVVRFSGAPGAGPDVPLFNTEITVASPAGQSTVLALLKAQQGVYRPAAVTAGSTGSGQPAVTLRFDVPVPAEVQPA